MSGFQYPDLLNCLAAFVQKAEISDAEKMRAIQFMSDLQGLPSAVSAKQKSKSVPRARSLKMGTTLDDCIPRSGSIDLLQLGAKILQHSFYVPLTKDDPETMRSELRSAIRKSSNTYSLTPDGMSVFRRVQEVAAG